MPRFKKKPIEVEAFRWTVDRVPDWWIEMSKNFRVDIVAEILFIPTNEGIMRCEKGDWIIKEPFDSKREVYPCKPDIFEKTYDYVVENEDY